MLDNHMKSRLKTAFSWVFNFLLSILRVEHLPVSTLQMNKQLRCCRSRNTGVELRGRPRALSPLPWLAANTLRSREVGALCLGARARTEVC